MNTFNAVTGYGLELVNVSYEYDDDSKTVDFTVDWNGREVSGLLSDDQIADIEMKCHANQIKVEKQFKEDAEYDLGETRYLDRKAA